MCAASDAAEGESMATCASMCMTCADMCNTMMRAMMRPMSYHSGATMAMLQACAAMCTACAEECMTHADMHEHCRMCAQACRDCASACQKVMDSMAPSMS
jgi:hypothetical protein